MLKNVIKRRPFIAGLVTGVVGIGILGGYLRKKIGHKVIILTAIIDGPAPIEEKPAKDPKEAEPKDVDPKPEVKEN